MKYLTINDVMDRLGIGQPDTVLRLIRSGQLKASNISASPGRASWRIAESDLLAWLESRVPVPPPAPPRRTRRRPVDEQIPEYV